MGQEKLKLLIQHLHLYQVFRFCRITIWFFLVSIWFFIPKCRRLDPPSFVSGRKPLYTKLGGKVPVVIVDYEDEADDVYGTITHNRARGTHLLEPMKAIVKKLLDEGKTVHEIGRQLGMKPEEIFRLSDFTREEFLAMMTRDVHGYSRAVVYRTV